MSSNSQIRVRHIRESTPGTTPGTAMDVLAFRAARVRRLEIADDRWSLYDVAPDGSLATIVQELPMGGGITYLQLRSLGGLDTGLAGGAGGDAVVYHSGAPGTATPGSPNPLNP